MDIGDENNALTFLKTLAEVADGDIEKPFDIISIWNNSRITSHSIDYFLKNILPELSNKRLIENDNNNNIRITEDGINTVADKFQIPSTTLGILSRDDVNKFSKMLVDYLYEQIRSGEDTFTIADIRKHRFGALSYKIIQQISRDLERKRLIHRIGKDKYKLTFSRLKKSVDAPQRRFS